MTDRVVTAAQADTRLVAELAVRARLLAGSVDGEVRVLSRRSGGVVVRVGGVVVKAHPRDIDPDRLTSRLRLAAASDLDGLLLRPLRHPGGPLVDRLAGHAVTAWPAGEPVDPDRPDTAPWSPAAELLARLHRFTPIGGDHAATPGGPVGGGAVPAGPGRLLAGAPARVARAITRLEREGGRHPAAAAVWGAYHTLPPWAYGEGESPGRPLTLCHGDWHLGQMVRVPAGWRLVDVEDLGYGDPAWDLARPAAWYATGLMSLEVWREFLDRYRAAGGPAVPGHSEPWPALDVAARALVVQMAALAVVEATGTGRPLDEIEQALIDTCRMIIAECGGVDVP